MRLVHLTFIVLFAVAMIVFAAQNFQTVTVAFLGFRASAPLAVLIVVIYVIGTATGSSLFALLRRLYVGSRGEART